MRKHDNNQFIEALLRELDENEKKPAGDDSATDSDRELTATQLHRLKVAFESHASDFRNDFTNRVMSQIGQLDYRQRNQQLVFKLLLRLSLTAVAAVLLLLLFVVWQENSLSIDSLLGIAGLKSDDFSTFLASY